MDVHLSKSDKDEEKEEEYRLKCEWARQMRLKFTPPDMLNSDGSLNHSYFKPRHSKVKEIKWTEHERHLLMEGIQRYGVGNWVSIRETLLPGWDANELRVKTSQLLGRQSLKLYKGWHGNESMIRAEFERNRQLALELGCWKGGLLVNDDEGKVNERLSLASETTIEPIEEMENLN